MKQIFDWLREQIKYAKFPITELKIGVEANGRQATDDVVLYKRAEQLINEAEAKWEADCCDYEYDKVSNLCRSSCNGWLLEGADAWHFSYCPICGKPIKISEVE